MKNTVMATLLVFVLMPGFGVSLLSGSPATIESSNNAENQQAGDAAAPAPEPAAEVDQQMQMVGKDQVASASSPQSAK
jgi:hypothetical protein